MRIWISALAIAFLCCLLNNGASAQAAAEGALTHALSSGVGTSLGNAMGHATNQMAGRVAQQTSHAAIKPGASSGSRRAAVPVATTTPTAAAQTPASANGSMIVSIQGGARQETACATASKPAEVTPAVANAIAGTVPPAPQTQVQPANCVSADPTAFAHPTEITLPEMK